MKNISIVLLMSTMGCGLQNTPPGEPSFTGNIVDLIRSIDSAFGGWTWILILVVVVLLTTLINNNLNLRKRLNDKDRKNTK
ncbi:MAG: hypothetical protein K1X91_10155 [Bacteriodetes bacterium]|nr:hypothetical protein [Bacteroidota bacterium]